MTSDDRAALRAWLIAYGDGRSTFDDLVGVVARIAGEGKAS